MNIATFRPPTGMHPITASQLDGLLQYRAEKEDLCFWPCPYGQNEVVLQGFVKCDDGVRHLVHRYTKVNLRAAALDTPMPWWACSNLFTASTTTSLRQLWPKLAAARDPG